MIKIENAETAGWRHAIRGMRNPMNSWDKSDSECCDTNDFPCLTCDKCELCVNGLYIGRKDYELMVKLSEAGTDHRKFMRMIVVYVDITAPLYWWKEFDTYKVGTVANSCSTMHKIADKEFEREDFSHEHLISDGEELLREIIGTLNDIRDIYNNFEEYKQNEELDPAFTDKKIVWWQMIQLLPSSYNQKRTVMLNYEVLANIYKSRRNHRLDEWQDFCDWIEMLPCSEIITDDRR